MHKWPKMEEDGIEFPHCWQVVVLTTHILDILSEPELDEAVLKELAKDCIPSEEDCDSKFVLQQPSIQGLSGSNTEVASAWARVVVDSLIPLINLGKLGVKKAASWTRALLELTEQLKLKRCIILQAAHSEVLVMLRAMKFLADDMEPAAEEMEAAQEILKARVGNGQILKNALLQNPFYKAQEASLKSSFTATLALKPEMERIQQGVREQSLDSISEAISCLPAWRNALRPGSTATVENSLAIALEELHGKFDIGETDTAAQERLVELCSLARKMPLTTSMSNAGISNSRYDAVEKLASQALQASQVAARKRSCLEAFADFSKNVKSGGPSSSRLKSVELLSSSIRATWWDKEEADQELLDTAAATLPLLSSTFSSALLTVLEKCKGGTFQEAAEHLKTGVSIVNTMRMLKEPSIGVYEKFLKLAEAAKEVRATKPDVSATSFLQLATKLQTAKREAEGLQGLPTSYQKLIEEVQLVQQDLKAQVKYLVETNLQVATEALKSVINDIGKWKTELSEDKNTKWEKVVEAGKPIVENAGLSVAYKALKKD